MPESSEAECPRTRETGIQQAPEDSGTFEGIFKDAEVAAPRTRNRAPGLRRVGDDWGLGRRRKGVRERH
jgi:hypothetical protein